MCQCKRLPAVNTAQTPVFSSLETFLFIQKETLQNVGTSVKYGQFISGITIPEEKKKRRVWL